MEIIKLEMLLELYEHKSLADIASKYNYTPSAISHMLKGLEDEIGVRLFVRDRAGIIVTPEGRAMLPYMRTLVSNYHEMENQADKLSGKEAGTIRLGAFTSVVVTMLPRIIKEFKTLHSDVEFEILQGNYRETEEWIKNGYVDCGFTVDIQSDNIESYRLTKDRLFVIYPEEHPLGKIENFSIKDIEDYPFITLGDGSEYYILDYIESQGINIKSICRVADDYAVSALVESGLGISIVPELFLYRAPYAVGSRCIDESFYRTISISYRKDYRLSPVMESFIDHVKDWSVNNKEIITAERSNRLIIDGDNTQKY